MIVSFGMLTFSLFATSEFDRSGMGLGAAMVGEAPATGPGIRCGTWAADALVLCCEAEELIPCDTLW